MLLFFYVSCLSASVEENNDLLTSYSVEMSSTIVFARNSRQGYLQINSSEAVIISPEWNQETTYKKGAYFAREQQQRMISQYVELRIKDEVPFLNKKISDEAYTKGYDEGYKKALEEFRQERNKLNITKKR